MPQDEAGDSSRILANFYLQDFDKEFFNYCKFENIQYLRYADDMIIMGHDQYKAKKALFFASKILSKIGLNINSAKVNIFESREDFNRYWAFDIFDKLGDKYNKEAIATAIEMYRNNQKSGKKFRNESVLKRFLSCDLSNIDIIKKKYILAEILTDDFLMNCDEFHLERLFHILDDKDKLLLKEKLEELIDIVYFNKYHYVLLKVSNLFGFDVEKIKIKIEELKF